MAKTKLKWYVVHTLTNSEKRAKKLLDIEIKHAIEAKPDQKLNFYSIDHF